MIDTKLGVQVAAFDVLGGYGATNFHLGEDAAGYVYVTFKT